MMGSGLQRFIFSAVLVLCSCATYQSDVSEARRLLESREASQAAEKLKTLGLTEGKDQLAYLLDYGLSLYEAGQNKESIKALIAADRLVDFNDYLSLSKMASSLVLSEGLVQYKGESFEKILINVYLAFNYIQLGDLEEAGVEARRMNLRMNQLIEAGEKDYNRSFLARYLSALIWEQLGNWDSAYIDYNRAFEIDPSLSTLKLTLAQAAYRAGRDDHFERLLKELHLNRAEFSLLSKQGELIVFSELGWVPRKGPSPVSQRIPQYFPVYSNTANISVQVGGGEIGQTETLFNVRTVAVQSLADQITALSLKRVAGVGVKAVVSKQIADQNQALGLLTWLVLNASDQADVRQWSTLPEKFQIFRRTLTVGEHKVKLIAENTSGSPTGETLEAKVVIRPGKKTILLWRAFR